MANKPNHTRTETLIALALLLAVASAGLPAFGKDATMSDAPTKQATPRHYLPDAILEDALSQSAPWWKFVPHKRSHRFPATFGLYTLALEIYLEQQRGWTPDPQLVNAVVERMRSVMSGGKEPECRGGLGGWSHGAFAWSMAFTRATDAAWGALGSEDRAKADLLMEALAATACFALDDDNNYRVMADGDRNYAKTWNPNHVEGYVGVALATAWYFGVDDLNRRLKNFDFDPFLAKLKEAGFTNIVGCWTHTPATRKAYMEGGDFEGDDPKLNYGTGVGVRGNHFTYLGMELDRDWDIYRKLAERMYCHVAQAELPVTGIEGLSTHIIAKDADGKYLISPYEGRQGMCMEFITGNAPKNGSKFRSSLSYVYEGWMNNMATATAVWARGHWPARNAENAAMLDAIFVGSSDFLFKAEHGYHGFANGKEQHSTGIAKHMAPQFPTAWWESVVKPAVTKSMPAPPKSQ